MKYLENQPLCNLGIELEQNAVDCVLDTRLECYSCKMVTADKRSYKDFMTAQGGKGNSNCVQALSPPPMDDYITTRDASTSRMSESQSGSPTLETCDVVSNKTLFYLIETLNASFPDYAFFNTTGRNFTKAPSISDFMHSVNTKLMISVKDYNLLKMYLWPVIDSAIDLSCSIVYSYLPAAHGDPFAEPGCIWSFNYIIYNRGLNRILFFSCRAMNPQTMVRDESDSQCQWDMDD